MTQPKVVILCGGRGERMGEMAAERPKPMVEVGGQPLLWHIMKHYERHGHRHFVLAVGRFGSLVQDYVNGLTNIGFVQGENTGWTTQNGGRVKRLAPYLTETFFLAWGDGVTDLDLGTMLSFHRSHGKLCTVATVQPPERFGGLEISWCNAPGYNFGPVREFRERGRSDQWINAGIFVCEPGVLGYVEGDGTQWEQAPMHRLVEDGQLMAFAHDGFWQCMDTPRDRRVLEELWASGNAPWKTWEG